MATLADYAGRTYDICAFQGQRAQGETLLDQTLINQSGLICTGVVKAAQRFVIRFLTERGSMPYRPQDGCEFLTKLRLGYLRQESDVFAAFALASADLLDQLAEVEDPATPADEQLTAASLTEMQIYPGYCKLRILLTTVAGNHRELILPIATS